MDAVATIWEEEGFPDEPISGNTDDPNDYAYLGAKHFGFFSSASLKRREKYIIFAQLVLLSLYIFLGKCVYFSIFE